MLPCIAYSTPQRKKQQGANIVSISACPKPCRDATIGSDNDTSPSSAVERAANQALQQLGTSVGTEVNYICLDKMVRCGAPSLKAGSKKRYRCPPVGPTPVDPPDTDTDDSDGTDTSEDEGDGEGGQTGDGSGFDTEVYTSTTDSESEVEEGDVEMFCLEDMLLNYSENRDGTWTPAASTTNVGGPSEAPPKSRRLLRSRGTPRMLDRHGQPIKGFRIEGPPKHSLDQVERDAAYRVDIILLKIAMIYIEERTAWPIVRVIANGALAIQAMRAACRQAFVKTPVKFAFTPAKIAVSPMTFMGVDVLF
ncbi:hypothetical protein OC835_008037, partial [Tilletia horrida]